MDVVLPIATVLSTFLALNIGANNSAASMATAYGAGARSKKEAVTSQNKHVLGIAFFRFIVPFLPWL